jgi:hypothetical protein
MAAAKGTASETWFERVPECSDVLEGVSCAGETDWVKAREKKLMDKGGGVGERVGEDFACARVRRREA